MFNRSWHAIVLPLSLCASLSSFAAHAQTSLDPVVVTASRTEQRLADALPATTVLTQAQIRASGLPDLAALLAREAGVQITQLGGVGTVSSASLRGAEARMTLVLIDGVPINNLNFAQAALEHVTLANIERVEIVRGNVSALYGAQATGGVIQIFTKQGAPGLQANAQAAAGNRGTREFAGSVRGGSAHFNYAASVGSYKTDGFSALDPQRVASANPDRDGVENLSGSISLNFALTQQHQLSLQHQHTRADVAYDSEFGPPTQADESRQTLTTTALKSRNRFGALQSDVSVAVSRDALDARTTAFPYFVNSKTTVLGWQNAYTAASGQTLSANLEHARQEIASDTTYDRDRRTIRSAALGYNGQFDAHALQLNARTDRYSDFGTANTYYAGYGWRFTPALRVSVAASTAFNAPTFNDLFFPGFSNPNLKPERTRSKELALQWTPGGAGAGQRVRAAVFENRYRDLIGFDENFSIVNIGQARNEGVELLAELRVAGFDLRASATQQRPRNDLTGQPLLRRADRLASISATRPFGAWDFNAALRGVGERADRGNRRLAGYATLDGRVAYRFTPNIAAALRVQNAFDRVWADAYGYNNTPRTVSVAVEGGI
jgi:vitamin B12 transporter